MVGHTLENLFAVFHRQVMLVEHVVDGRALVPCLGEGRALADDVAEHRHCLRQIARLHQAHALLVECVDGGVTGAAPQSPDDHHGGLAQAWIGVEQTRHQGIGVAGSAGVCQANHALQPPQRIGMV